MAHLAIEVGHFLAQRLAYLRALFSECRNYRATFSPSIRLVRSICSASKAVLLANEIP